MQCAKCNKPMTIKSQTGNEYEFYYFWKCSCGASKTTKEER